jgi:hypothetical protein
MTRPTLPQLPNVSQPKRYERVPEILGDVVEELNKIIDDLNFLLSNLGISGNLNGVIREITIPATSEGTIFHYLQVIPKYRLILRQTGNGVITDVDSLWTKEKIVLYNNGASAVTITVAILKE